MALTEPGGGSDLQAMRTVAVCEHGRPTGRGPVSRGPGRAHAYRVLGDVDVPRGQLRRGQPPPPGRNQSVIAWIMPSRARPVSDGDITSNAPAATPAAIVSSRASARRAAAGRCTACGRQGTAPVSPRPSPRSCGGSPCRERGTRSGSGTGPPGHRPPSPSACSQRSITELIERSSSAVRMASLLA